MKDLPVLADYIGTGAYLRFRKKGNYSVMLATEHRLLSSDCPRVALV